MQSFGLPAPAPAMAGPSTPYTKPPQQLTIGGIVSAKPLSTLLAEEATAAAVARAQTANATTIVSSLVAHIQGDWQRAKQAKLHIEQEMLEAVYSRRGEYSPDKLTKIRSQGGSEIYMMLFATKARQAKALLTDVLIGAGTDKPWTISPSPKPDIPPDQVSQILQSVQQVVMQAQMSGTPMQNDDIRQMLRDAKDAAEHQIMESARREAETAEVDLEDIMVEGGYMEALDQFIDDLTIFKTAFLKGPIVSRENVMTWTKNPGQKSTPVVQMTNKLKWERVDPFNMYPSRYSRTVNDGPLIERHRLTRGALSAMIGCDGYSDDAIRAVLDANGAGGLHEWLMVDTQRATAENRRPVDPNVGVDTIDALQYWGSCFLAGKISMSIDT